MQMSRAAARHGFCRTATFWPAAALLTNSAKLNLVQLVLNLVFLHDPNKIR